MYLYVYIYIYNVYIYIYILFISILYWYLYYTDICLYIDISIYWYIYISIYLSLYIYIVHIHILYLYSYKAYKPQYFSAWWPPKWEAASLGFSTTARAVAPQWRSRGPVAKFRAHGGRYGGGWDGDFIAICWGFPWESPKKMVVAMGFPWEEDLLIGSPNRWGVTG
jgi:hypothetical protein